MNSLAHKWHEEEAKSLKKSRAESLDGRLGGGVG